MPSFRRCTATALAVLSLGALAAAAPDAGERVELSALSAANGGTLAPDQRYLLPLASGTIDPLRDLQARDPAGQDLVLVQLADVGIPGAVEAVAAAGARLVQPLAPVSLLVWADAAATQAVRALDVVRFAGVLPPAARIAADVEATTTRLRVTVVGDAPLPELLGLGVERSWQRPFTRAEGHAVVVPGGRETAERLAELPQVVSVAAEDGRPALRDELGSQVVAAGTEQAPAPGYAAFLERIGADGSGVIVGHVDGGVDANHPDLAGRIEACLEYGAPGCEVGNHDDVVGHGTHTLGIVLGTGSSGFGDLEGFVYGLGVAPGATAVVQNAINAASDLEPPYAPIYRDAQRLGATVSQNAWGPAGTPQGYDEDTREMDTVVRDVDPERPGDQPIGLVFSIMNGGGGVSTQGSPDEAKNILGVGGTGLRGYGAPGVEDLCTCSAHGPALDGRLLPQLVAPGQQVVSARATQGTLCGLIGVGYVPTTPVLDAPSPLHAGCTGTSMASPHVSGAWAVFTDWYRQHHAGATPSPALVKAALVNQADDLSRRGGVDADGRPLEPVPNPQQGWGRLALGATVDAWRAGVVHVDQTVVLDDAGERFEVTVEAVDPAAPLRVSLAWTDAPGHGEGGELPAWVNDLDLQVVGPDGTTWRGNVFADGWSVPGGVHDERNNLENVFLPVAGPGVHTVTVTAANVIGDGLPNAGDATDQDFALVVANAREAG